MIKIYYWRDVIGDNEQFEPYHRDIEDLLAGNYASLSLEKLRTRSQPSIYSIRVGKEKATRILFTQYKSSICLLDVVLNHDYDKSRFLKHPAILKAFLKKISEDLPAIEQLPQDSALPEMEFVPHLRLDGLEASPIDVCSMTPLGNYQHHLVEFNTDQNQTLEKPLPLILLGPAGSGKTCVALSLLSKHTLKHYKPGSSPAIYITQSETLVKEMRRDWNDTTPVELQSSVLFKTYDDVLIDQLDPKITLVKESHFVTWYKDKYKKKLTSASDDGSLDTKSIWMELRIRSGYSEEGYLELGERQSSVDSKGRQLICGCYNAYMSFLKTNNLVSPALQDLSPSNYSLVVVDEAQDMSYGQLNQLRLFAPKSQIAFLLGEHQILFDGKSRFNYLKQLFFANKTDVSISRLLLNYRSSPAVLNVANGLINLKYQVTGGAADKEESAAMIPANKENLGNGKAEWLSPESKDVAFYCKLASTNSDVAVITWPDFITDAKELFNTPLVLTPPESKGLEFDIVIFWRPFDNADCYRACEKLSEMSSLQANVGGHRAKKGQSFESLLPYFNELITAVTRAEKQMIMIQGKQHKARLLTDAIKAIMMPEKPGPDIKCEVLPVAATNELAPAFLTPSPVVSSRGSWEKRVMSFIKKGNLELARTTYVEKIDPSDQGFEIFYANHTKSHAPPSSGELVNHKNIKLTHQPKVGVRSKSSLPNKEVQDSKIFPKICELLANNRISYPEKIDRFIGFLREDLEIMQDPLVTEWIKDELRVKGDKDIENTFLFKLTIDMGYHKILFHIINSRPDLVAVIPKETWEGGITKNTVFKHATPLYFLANFLEGRRMLEVLINKHPETIAAISPTVWSLPLTEGHNKNMSTLYRMVVSPQGLTLLYALINKCPEVIRKIPYEGWYQRLPKESSSANLSVLYILTTNPDGLRCLNELFKKFPNIAKNIPEEAWTTYVPINSIEDAASPLLNVLLNGSVLGLTNTISLLDDNGFDRISKEQWDKLLTSPLCAAEKTVFVPALMVGKLRKEAIESMKKRYLNFAASWDECNMLDGHKKRPKLEKRINSTPSFFDSTARFPEQSSKAVESSDVSAAAGSSEEVGFTPNHSGGFSKD